MTPAVTLGMVQTESFAMDYLKFGRGESALVILPGLSVQSVMTSANAIAQAYRPLVEDCTIYVLDRRKDLPASYPLRDMARDTQQAIRELGLDRVFLMGMSQGGMIAMTIAIEQPDLVRKLVLCSTSSRTDDHRFQTVEAWIRLAKAENAAELYRSFGKALFTQALYEQLEAPLLAAAKTVTADDLDRFITLAEGMRGFDVTDDLEAIVCPVFVIGSKDDQVLGADATMQIAGHLADRDDFELHLYDGYGHAAYDTAPDFKERVLRFLMQ